MMRCGSIGVRQGGGPRHAPFLVLAALAVACAGAPRSRTTGPPVGAAEARALARTEMGWVALRDLHRTSRALAPWLKATPAAVQEQLLRAAGLDRRLGPAIDGDRPLVISLLDPHRRKLPVLVAVPIKDGASFLAEVAKLSPRVDDPAAQRTPGLHVFDYGLGGRFYVTIEDGQGGPIAYLAFDLEAARGAPVLLGPRMRQRPPAMMVARATPRVVGRLGALEQSLASFLTITGADGDAANEYALRGLHRTMAYLSDASALELRIDLGPRGLALTVRMEGKQGGAWAEYVEGREPAGSWGARFVPRDAVLTHLSRPSARDREADAEALESYLVTVADHGMVPPTERARWHTALAGAIAASGDQQVFAVWPAAGGGIGAGGAYTVKDMDAARRAARTLYTALGPVLGRAAAQQLELDPGTYPLVLGVRQNATLVQGAQVDLIELTPAFPSAAKEQRAAFVRLFGERLTLAIAYVDGAAVFALGRDWQSRLGQLVAAARGLPGPSLADTPGFARALADDAGRVSLVYLRTQGLAGLILGVLADADAGVAAAGAERMQAFLRPGQEHSAIVVVTRVRQLRRGMAYELTTRVPPTVLSDVAGMGGAMWRVALSPILGAPPVPPLPLPPSNLTPPAAAPSRVEAAPPVSGRM